MLPVLERYQSEGTDNSGIPSKPCGVAILTADRPSGLRARRDLPPGIPRSIVTINDRCRGGLIESMDPVSRLGQVTGSGTPPKNAGRPENIHTFLAQDSVLSTVLGSTDYLVLITIEE